MSFQIHHQLIQDCHQLGKFDLCHVLLHKNASVPWFILVPETNLGIDLLDLPEPTRNLAMSESERIAGFIRTKFALQKINFAAIGNVVAQLHIHVVGRRPDDPCWPAPVWGNLSQVRDYSTEDVGQLKQELARNYFLKIA